MDITVNKFLTGAWHARSTVKLDDIGLENKIVMFSTYRNDRGTLITTARVEHDYGDTTSYYPCFDYYKVIIATTVSRVTAKAVEQQHKLIVLDDVLVDIAKHYKLQAKEETFA